MDHQTVADILEKYGYFAVFLGVVIEGETPLLMAGFAAHRGLLSLPLAILAAFLGAVAGDIGWFYLGRLRGTRIVEKRPKWREKAALVDRKVQAHSTLMVLGFRFLYGLRTVAPIAIGMTKISPVRFVALDVLGSAIWTAFFAGLGYGFGSAIERFLGRIEGAELPILGSMAVGGGIVWLVMHRPRRREPAPPGGATA